MTCKEVKIVLSEMERRLIDMKTASITYEEIRMMTSSFVHIDFTKIQSIEDKELVIDFYDALCSKCVRSIEIISVNHPCTILYRRRRSIKRDGHFCLTM
jgi:hypothetical protein